MPGARVRCYKFAEYLKRFGMDARVMSYKDHLGAKDGAQESMMEDAERIWRNIKAFFRFPRNPDTILCLQRIHYHYLGALRAHEAWGCKLVLDVDDWDLKYNPFNGLSKIPWLKGKYLHKKIGSISECCIAASRNLEEYLKTINPKTHYIPTGVDTEQFDITLTKDRGRKDSEVVFSWVGTVFRKDNVENLLFIIDRFAELNAKNKNVRLEIVGGGPLMGNIISYMEHRYKNANIKLMGWISPSEIQNYLAAIDVGLFPLMQNSNFNISKSPTKLFEYMALGKPTVSHKIGDIAHVITHGENGFLVDLNAPQTFTEYLEILAEDESLRKKMGENAYEHVTKNYSLNVVCRKLYEILESL